jgi:AMIN domain
MQHKKLTPRFWTDLQKLSVRSIAPALFGPLSLSLSLAVAVAVATLPAAQQQANASTATSWQFDPETNELVISLPEGTTPKYSVVNRGQIAVDLPNIEVGVDATQLYPSGMVRSVGVIQLQPGTARIVVNLAPGMTVRADRIQFQRVGADNRWVLVPSIEPSGPETPETSAESVLTTNSTAAEVPTEPAPPQVANFQPNPLQSPTPNDQIRPITVPFVNVRVNEKPQTQVAAGFDRPNEVVAVAPAQQPISFGEPLPRQSRTSVASDNFNPPLQTTAGAEVLLPVGTNLSLVYAGASPLRLQPKPSRQEVLLLQGGILDSRGNSIVPANTPVIGRFETTNLGTRFVAQAILLNGRNVPLTASSEPIGGRRQRPSDRSLFRNSGIGGVALFLLSGFSGIGLLAGAAVGATTTYVTAPQPATIQPGQIFQVSLTEDFSLQ